MPIPTNTMTVGGRLYEFYIGDDPPPNPKIGAYWFDTLNNLAMVCVSVTPVTFVTIGLQGGVASHALSGASHTGSLGDGQHGDRSGEGAITMHDASQIANLPADERVQVKEGGVAVGDPRPINFTNTSDFTITEDVGNDEIEVSIRRNVAGGIAGLTGGSILNDAQLPPEVVMMDMDSLYVGTTTQNFGSSGITLRIPPKTGSYTPTVSREIWYNSTTGSFMFSDEAAGPVVTRTVGYVGTTVSGTIQPDDTASAGTSLEVSRVDHRHAIATATAVGLADSNAEGDSTSFARANHTHKRDVKVAVAGSAFTPRNRLNFIASDSTGISVADDSGNDEIDIDLTRVPRVAHLTADYVTTTNGFETIISGAGSPTLGHSLANGFVYHFRFVILWTSSATANGVVFSVSGPTNSMLQYRVENQNVAISTVSTDGYSVRNENAYDTGTALTTSPATAGDTFMCIIEGIIRTTAAGAIVARVKSENASPSAITIQSESVGFLTRYP